MRSAPAPARQETFHGFPGDKDAAMSPQNDGNITMKAHELSKIEELPRYAEELEGSTGAKRHELPAWPGAT